MNRQILQVVLAATALVALLAWNNPAWGQARVAGTSGTGANGVEAGVPASVPAPMPQYWVADASIFISNGVNTAAVMQQEGRMNMRAPSVIGSQASHLIETVNRALGDLNALEANALETNPRAVPAIRDAIAQLVAAKAEAARVVTVARRGQLGPMHHVMIVSAVNHLVAAERAMTAVGHAYGAAELAAAATRAGGMGGAGFVGAGLGGTGMGGYRGGAGPVR